MNSMIFAVCVSCWSKRELGMECWIYQPMRFTSWKGEMLRPWSLDANSSNPAKGHLYLSNRATNPQ